MDQAFGKQEMKDYLLGTLDTERRTALEEKILCDPAVYEELLAVGEELIDQYASGRLSKLEQRQFKTHFLIIAEREKNLRFGKLLERYRTTAPAKKSFPLSLASFARGLVGKKREPPANERS